MRLEPSPAKTKGSGLFLTLCFIFTIAVIGSAGVAGYITLKSFSSLDGPNGMKAILLPRKASLQKVSEILHSSHIIMYPVAFKILLRLTGGHTKVRAGEFRFSTGSSLWSAMHDLYSGEPILHSVTIPEGWNIQQIATLLEKEQLVDREAFLKLALSRSSSAKYKLKTPHLEGFLFPDTYSFSKIDGEERIIGQMVDLFFIHYNRSLKQDAESLGFSIEQLVTLASVIEKETGNSEERTLVSSVFHNRLKKKMRLQSDPTTIYGIPNFNGNLTKADLRTPTPYNTYTINGLPPGPIASPGLETLKATLYPANTEFLYFVSNNQGKHIFSKTYGEHARHVNGYQPALPRRKSPKNPHHGKSKSR